MLLSKERHSYVSLHLSLDSMCIVGDLGIPSEDVATQTIALYPTISIENFCMIFDSSSNAHTPTTSSGASESVSSSNANVEICGEACDWGGGLFR